MRKGILAIAAAGSIFALTAAGASIGISYTPAAAVITVTGSGTSTVSTASCIGTPVFAYTDPSSASITKVTVTGLVCPEITGVTYAFAVTLTDNEPTTPGTYTGTLTVAGGAPSVTVDVLLGKVDGTGTATPLNLTSLRLVSTALVVTPAVA